MYLLQSINLHILIKLSAYFTLILRSYCYVSIPCLFFFLHGFVCFLIPPTRGHPLLKYTVVLCIFRRQVCLVQISPWQSECQILMSARMFSESSACFIFPYLLRDYWVSKAGAWEENVGVSVPEAKAGLVCECDQGALLGHEWVQSMLCTKQVWEFPCLDPLNLGCL